MPRFTEEWLQELLYKSDILDVIGQYLTLERRGTRYWARCPWHSERNASFCVTPEKQMYYCFSCKKGGGVVNFVMEHEHLSYTEAVSVLAERAGLELPEATEDTDYQKKKDYRKRLQEMMKELALYYHQNLLHESGEKAREYLIKRGISTQIGPYGLGYAKNAYDDAYRYLLSKGYTLKEMEDAGVARYKDGRTYDFFRNRVLFPIQNVMDDVIAFGGRVLDDGEPKYLNSGETALFNKRYNLFGLNKVRKIRNLKNIILTEGYMDVVALSAAGINNAVASLGTALTKEQARLMKKYAPTVYLCYDGDEAGVNASLRAVDILEAEGLKVLVILLPEGMDPDDFLKAYGATAFRRLGKQATLGVEFKIKILKRGHDLSIRDQAIEYATKAAELIAAEKNELVKEKLVNVLSNETGISEGSLQKQLAKSVSHEMYILPKNDANLTKKDSSDEEKLLSLLMERPDLLDEDAASALGAFSDETYHKIYLYIYEQRKKGILTTSAELLTVFSEQNPVLAAVMANSPPEGVDAKDYMEALIRKIGISRLKDKRDGLLKEIELRTGEEKQELMREVVALNKQLHGLSEGDHFFRR